MDRFGLALRCGGANREYDTEYFYSEYKYFVLVLYESTRTNVSTGVLRSCTTSTLTVRHTYQDHGSVV